MTLTGCKPQPERCLLITVGVKKAFISTDRAFMWVPQGSVFEPTFWNALYYGAFVLDMLKRVILVGKADDLAVVVWTRENERMHIGTKEVLSSVRRWTEGVGLEIAVDKTEAVYLRRVAVYLGGGIG